MRGFKVARSSTLGSPGAPSESRSPPSPSPSKHASGDGYGRDLMRSPALPCPAPHFQERYLPVTRRVKGLQKHHDGAGPRWVGLGGAGRGWALPRGDCLSCQPTRLCIAPRAGSTVMDAGRPGRSSGAKFESVSCRSVDWRPGIKVALVIGQSAEPSARRMRIGNARAHLPCGLVYPNCRRGSVNRLTRAFALPWRPTSL